MRAKISGSCLRTHSSLGAVKPGMAMLPAISRSCGTEASSSRHSVSERPSFQRIAERKTSPCASSSVAPCIWPVRPSASICVARMPAARASPSRSASAAFVACHQSCGACSDQRGCGRLTESACVAVQRTRPSRSSNTALTPDVPRSIPMNMSPSSFCASVRFASPCAIAKLASHPNVFPYLADAHWRRPGMRVSEAQRRP